MSSGDDNEECINNEISLSFSSVTCSGLVPNGHATDTFVTMHRLCSV